jgi:NADH dehydrogenase
MSHRPHTVIVGAGFGGLYAARVLGTRRYPVTVIDRRNFHLFQPLLYQVATGGLSPGDISSPIRAVVGNNPGTTVLQETVTDVDPRRRTVRTSGSGEVSWDRLIVATGVRHDYFGNDQWEQDAPGLKTIEDAIDMRRRILEAFERAELEPDDRLRQRLLTFVIVGGGPTGVELAGALAELSRATLQREFHRFDPAAARVYLIEGTDRLIPGYHAGLSAKSRTTLERMGVEVLTGALVKDIDATTVTLDRNGVERIEASTILWAAGVRASAMGRVLERRAGARLDEKGRVFVTDQLSLASHPDIHVIGDLARAQAPDGGVLPGVAQVAIQQGRYVARGVMGRNPRGAPFRYRDLGRLAVIGRNHAVAEIGRLRFSGLPAWLIWVFLHIAYLIEYDNRVIVLTQWAMNYFTRKRGARLITSCFRGKGEKGSYAGE